MTIRSHEDLFVWQRSVELAVAVHRLVKTFRAEDRISYGDQFRRAAVSVAANIAEGAARVHSREFLHFLSIARGSLVELATHLAIAEKLQLSQEEELAKVRELLDHVGRMLTRLLHRLADKNRR